MKKWIQFDFVHLLRQILCLLICALFVLPAAAVAPQLTTFCPPSEERGESKNQEDSDDDNRGQDSMHQSGRRSAAQSSTVTHSTQNNSNATHRFSNSTLSQALTDVFQNGLGNRLRC